MTLPLLLLGEIKHASSRPVPLSEAAKGPQSSGCINARPSKRWALSQNMTASSSLQLHPQDRAFSTHRAFHSAGARSVECEHSDAHSCRVFTTYKVAGFLGGVTGQREMQVSHWLSVYSLQKPEAVVSTDISSQWACKRKRRREPSVATGQGRGGVPCTPVPAAHCSFPGQPASTRFSGHTLPHSAPQGSDQTSDRTAARAHIHTGTTPAPSSPPGPSVVLCVRLNTKALEEVDQSTSPLSCFSFYVLEG